MWTKHDGKSFLQKKPCDETSFDKQNTSLPLGSTPDRLREAAAAQAAFRSSSTRSKGEPQRRRFLLFSKWTKNNKMSKMSKNVHLFKVSLFLLACFARWSSTFWNSRARWILRWNGKVGSGQFTTDLVFKMFLQTRELTSWLDTGRPVGYVPEYHQNLDMRMPTFKASRGEPKDGDERGR